MKNQFVIFIVLLFSLVQLSAQEWQQKIDAEILAELQAGAKTEAIIAFVEQADLSPAYRLKTKEAKAHFVYQQVQEVASRSQAQVVTMLDNAGLAYQSMAIANAIVVQLDLNLAQQIAQEATVKNIQPNPWTTFDAPAIDRSLGTSRGTLEWGVEKIKANDVWDLGFLGEGVVVGGQDTGYEWFHPAIQDRYRGWDGQTAEHNHNWHDAIHEINLSHNDSLIVADNNPCGLDSNIPCDDHNHGTHTMGTMIGGEVEDDNAIGVAPMAQWIGCRNMERGAGTPATYIECFDWFLAPTDLNGENADPSAAPHVINNSWGCPVSEGCNPENFELMEIALNALRASGVVVVVSAGNSGSNCNSINNPAAIFEGSFTIGASNRRDSIAGFSSRGAVSVDSTFRLKPNVVAPGVSVRSATRGGNYATWNGTSMAGPHVAGAVALIISAAPHLAGQVDVIENILEETALPIVSEQDCDQFPGMAIPNTTYGYGRIDVLAAVQRALEIVNTDEEQVLAVELFPNPTHDHVWVKGWINESSAQFSLFDASGRKVTEKLINSVFEKVELTDLPKGVYHYRLEGGAVLKVGKLVIQ